ERAVENVKITVAKLDFYDFVFRIKINDVIRGKWSLVAQVSLQGNDFFGSGRKNKKEQILVTLKRRSRAALVCVDTADYPEIFVDVLADAQNPPGVFINFMKIIGLEFFAVKTV